MSHGAARVRRVVVVGPPGAGGEHVAGALVGAGCTDASAEVAARNDALLATKDATRVVPPPLGVGGAPSTAPLVDGDGGSDTPPSVAHDDATAFTFELEAPVADASVLHVVIWCEPSRSVDRLAAQGIGAAHATALWNRSLRATTAALRGRRVVVVDGEALAAGGEAGAAALVPLMQGLALAPLPPRAARPDGPAPEGAVTAAALGVVPLGPGWHDAWKPSAATPAPPWCEELLLTAWRAHRALLEAREAWRALDERRRATSADDPAVVAVRARDIVRLRDQVRGLEAELQDLRAKLGADTAERAALEQRAGELGDRVAALEQELTAAQAEVERMASSWPWRVGRALTAPARHARRVLKSE